MAASKRRVARNHQQFWAAKLARAMFPRERALTAFDRVRADIRHLPAAEQDVAWNRLADQLERFDAELDMPYLTKTGGAR